MPPLSLMAFWKRHKSDCRSISGILIDARNGRLPGVEPANAGFSFIVTDENAALAAMRKG